MKKRILVACEYSGRVRKAFAARGWDAWSCDLLPSETPGQHYQGDVADMLAQRWDLMIAHPPCTHLAGSGARHFASKQASGVQQEALAFVQMLLGASVKYIALENPVSVISSRIRKPSQIIQPWWFGEDASKKTCLWLKGLPNLTPYLPTVKPPKGWSKVMCAADMLECEDCGEPFCPECNDHYADCECIGPTEDEVEYKMVDGVLFGTRETPAPKMRWGNQTESGQNNLGPSPTRWKERSRTYEGIAQAMADQWGAFIEGEGCEV